MFGERLRRFRVARSMSLRDLEAAVDGSVSSQTLSKYERGELQPTATTLTQIAATLGVKPSQLLGEPSCDIETNELLNHTVDPLSDGSLSERRRFLQLPKKERDRILSEQAKEMADFYEHDMEWREWLAGPIIEYDIP